MNVPVVPAGLSSPAQQALARSAALAAAAALPDPDPVAVIEYHSGGRTLMIGAGAELAPLAAAMPPGLPLTVLVTDGAVLAGAQQASRVHLAGWLGAFEAMWETADGAIVRAGFDLVLDLSVAPLIGKHEKPPGYVAPAATAQAQADALTELAGMIGDYEKPRYFQFREKLCAHSRNQLVGCSACIDICSAEAISGNGDRIAVNANLCAGCGACGTVCPTGALRYDYPSAPYTGARLRALIAAYRAAGGGAPSLLFHDGEAGKAQVAALEETGSVPAHVIPIELEHVASVGIDVWLAAYAYGAGEIAVLAPFEVAPAYRTALAAQMAIANTVLDGLGYGGLRCRLLDVPGIQALAAALDRPAVAACIDQAATFHVAAEKRNTLDMALHHLASHAPARPQAIALPAGAPLGDVVVDPAKCSLCMSCVGACPSSALMDSTTLPQLRFVEKNCVQCGLCETTCPENAITLAPRLLLTSDWNQSVIKHGSTPFCCICCGKPFGSLQMIDNMLAKMGGHPAFAGHLDRLRMCGDCRVIDIMKTKDSDRIVGR